MSALKQTLIMKLKHLRFMCSGALIDGKSFKTVHQCHCTIVKYWSKLVERSHGDVQVSSHVALLEWCSIC